jgi:hypothetical protein
MYLVQSMNFHSEHGTLYSVFIAVSPYTVRIKDVVVMQLTGITDRNDNPIYEGDILGLDDPTDKSRVVIVFRNAAFHAELIGASYIDDPHWTTIDSGWVVIGNRYENPELLEVGRQ